MAIQTTNTRPSDKALELVLLGGDLSKLDPGQKVAYYNAVCESVGLNPLTNPFAYMTLKGKETLYAKRDATDQLRKIHTVSIKIVSREKIGDAFQVTAQAILPSGRTDESIGAVNLGGLKGDDFANALMKAETKAKRRVTLSICGLGMLDETEEETIVPRETLPATGQVEVKTRPSVVDAEPSITDLLPDMPEIPPFEPPETAEAEWTTPPGPEPKRFKPLVKQEHNSKVISEPQRRRLFAISKTAKWSEDEVKSLVHSYTGQESTAAIPWILYDSICNEIDKHPKQ